MSTTAIPAPSQHEDAAVHALRLIAYFDIFSHPLSRTDLARMGTNGPDSRETLQLLVDSLLIEQTGRFYHLPGRQNYVERRQARAWNAETMWPTARRSARLLSRLPFVEGLMVTGALSKNSVSTKDDIDFLVFVRPGRVWTTKTFLQFARMALPHNVRECFCTNYLVASDALVLDDQTMFTAVELATAVPVYNGALCAAFLQANESWARHYVPGIGWSIERAQALADVQDSAETVALPPNWLERRCLNFWDRYWNRKYNYLSDDTRSQRFKRRPDRATNHLHDFQDYVLQAMSERCARLGISIP